MRPKTPPLKSVTATPALRADFCTKKSAVPQQTKAMKERRTPDISEMPVVLLMMLRGQEADQRLEVGRGPSWVVFFQDGRVRLGHERSDGGPLDVEQAFARLVGVGHGL